MKEINKAVDIENNTSESAIKQVVLITCGSIQKGAPCEAQDLYQGDFFKVCFDHAKKHFRGCDKYILSTKFGILKLNERIDKEYNYSFRSIPGAKKVTPTQWGKRVISQLKKQGYNINTDEFIVYAGADYRNALLQNGLYNLKNMFAGRGRIGEIRKSLKAEI